MTATAVQPDLVTTIRLRTHKYMPYLARVIYAMPVFCRPGIGTMAVDKQGRCYFDPAWVSTLSLDQCAYTLLHEVLHVVLRHVCVMEKLIGGKLDQKTAELANIAVDLVVEQLLRGPLLPFRPEGGVCIEEYGFPPRLSAPEYFRLLVTHREQQQSGQQHGGQLNRGQGQPASNGQGQPKGGSCADGIPRAYEEPADPAWEAHRQDRMFQALEQGIAKHDQATAGDSAYRARHPGSVPGCLRESVEAQLRPQPDPWDKLKSAVARSVASIVGSPTYTYRRVSRRQQEGMPRLLGVSRATPTAVVILDTSMSMTNGEDQIRALTVIAQGLRKLRSFHVFAGDTSIRSDKRISALKQVEWAGGGGTDMATLLEEVDARHKPDTIVIITDGETGWPATELRARVIAALTRKRSPSFPIPGWVKAIEVGGVA